jgi:hypothetical protein
VLGLTILLLVNVKRAVAEAESAGSA